MADTITKAASRDPAGQRRRPLRKINAAMRQRIELAIQTMIDALDALDAPAEEGDELDKLEASDLEIAGEADGSHGDCVDDEPSLGSLDGRVSQKRWGLADRRDYEWYAMADREQDEAENDEAEHEDGVD